MEIIVNNTKDSNHGSLLAPCSCWNPISQVKVQTRLLWQEDTITEDAQVWEEQQHSCRKPGQQCVLHIKEEIKEQVFREIAQTENQTGPRLQPQPGELQGLRVPLRQ